VISPAGVGGGCASRTCMGYVTILLAVAAAVSRLIARSANTSTPLAPTRASTTVRTTARSRKISCTRVSPALVDPVRISVTSAPSTSMTTAVTPRSGAYPNDTFRAGGQALRDGIGNETCHSEHLFHVASSSRLGDVDPTSPRIQRATCVRRFLCNRFRRTGRMVNSSPHTRESIILAAYPRERVAHIAVTRVTSRIFVFSRQSFRSTRSG
jgi:hypothetical protein